MTLLAFKSAPNIDQGDLVVDEFKFVDAQDDTATFTGYGSIFGNIDNGRDMVMKGAFAESLSRGPKSIKMLWQHDPSQPIGVWTDAKEDARGLKMSGKLLLTISKAREVYEMMKAGIVEGLSIGFKTMKESYDTEKGGRGYRKIEKADLWEVSLVTFPMNPKATVTAVKTMPSERELEAMLRDEARLSDRQAKAAVAIFKKSFRDGEAERHEAPRDAEVQAISRELDKFLTRIKS